VTPLPVVALPEVAHLARIFSPMVGLARLVVIPPPYGELFEAVPTPLPCLCEENRPVRLGREDVAVGTLVRVFRDEPIPFEVRPVVTPLLLPFSFDIREGLRDVVS